MRAILGFLALFGVAVAAALFLGNNQGTVTLFWPPYRIDLSLNFVLIVLTAAFLLLHLALRTLGAMFDLPVQARRWRAQHREHALFAHLLDAQLHNYAGRFLRARKAAQAALEQEQALKSSGTTLDNAERARTLGHLLAAEAAHALRVKDVREQHLQQVLPFTEDRTASEAQESILLRATEWALDDLDPTVAQRYLDALPQGAARRTLALRLRLKRARLAGEPVQALETARLLAKHQAFSAQAAHSLIRGLAQDVLSAARDPDQLVQAWGRLDATEQRTPEVAVHAAQRMQTLGGDVARALQWVLPAWDRLAERPRDMSDALRLRLIQVLQTALQKASGVEAVQWLARVETAQRQHPTDPSLQYLAGRVYEAQQLWGKAQQMLELAVKTLVEPALQRQAWRALEALALQRGDTATALRAQHEASLI